MHGRVKKRIFFTKCGEGLQEFYQRGNKKHQAPTHNSGPDPGIINHVGYEGGFIGVSGLLRSVAREIMDIIDQFYLEEKISWQ